MESVKFHLGFYKNFASSDKGLQFHYRSLLGQRKYSELESSIVNKKEFRSLMNLVETIQGKQSENVVTSPQQIPSNSIELDSVFICQTFILRSDIENALNVLGTDIESLSLKALILIRINRIDLAQTILSQMQNISVDNPLCHLVEGYIDMLSGKYQEAFYIFEELLDRFGSSPKLLNSKAVCLCLLGKWNEAENVLKSHIGEGSADIDTISNLITVYANLGKYDLVEKFVGDLQSSDPFYGRVKDIKLKSQLFDACCQKYL
jgi:coatomer protein complex subunit epsilon